MSLLLAAGACWSQSVPPITEQQVCPYRLPQLMYAVLADYASFQEPSQQIMELLSASMHTDRISNSAILSNYVSLLSDLCACVQVTKVVSQMKP